MLNPLSWLSGLLSAFTALADRIVQAWQREKDRQAGRNEQKVADLTRDAEAERERRNVDAVVSAADPVQHQRMLDRWTRR